MKNREAILRKLDQMESNFTKITMGLNTGNRTLCYEVLEQLKNQLDQCKLYIESEPILGQELNR
jgi:hypothetical protein